MEVFTAINDPQKLNTESKKQVGKHIQCGFIYLAFKEQAETNSTLFRDHSMVNKVIYEVKQGAGYFKVKIGTVSQQEEGGSRRDDRALRARQHRFPSRW